MSALAVGVKWENYLDEVIVDDLPSLLIEGRMSSTTEAGSAMHGGSAGDMKWNREFEYYWLTEKDREHLVVEESRWKPMAEAVARVMWPATEES
jgi:hypothetical protein